MQNKKFPSTQDHLDIEDIREDLVILKNGNASAVLQTTAVNFDLLSESEQDAMIFAFAGLLNSLSFPIQILVRSKRMDISNYLARLEGAKFKVHNQALAGQIAKYQAFIKDLVSKNQVLDKRFYVVVPYFSLSISQLTGSLGGLMHQKNTPVASKWTTLEKAKSNVETKVLHLIKQFARIGVRAERLRTEQLVELYYDLYNPEVAREQKAALGTKEYTTPMVEPQIAPMPATPEKEVPNGS